jgi:hypothetical protein
MSALKNYTLASDNANDFHKRVDVLLLQALQIITTDTLETMSSQTCNNKKTAIEDSINIFAGVNTIVEDQQIAKSWVAGEGVSVGEIRV